MNCSHCNTPLPTNSRFCLSCGADLSDPGAGPRSTTTSTGQMLLDRLGRVLEGRYRVTKMLGRGGMGAVFLAEDLALERPVAIKVLPPDVSHDDSLVGRFEREARTAARLDHPNIIPIFAVESADDLHFFVMKFVAGEPLDGVLKRGALPLETSLTYLWEAATALGHAHRRGVVHRDVKPANIMLDHDGRIILTDFGISKAMQSATQLTGTGQVIGTPHYMSPEQARGGEVDGRSDQYALGVLGYQMVSGRLPFEDASVHALIFKHVQEPPPLLRDVFPETPPYVATAIHRALAKDPDDRFPTMEEFATALVPGRRLSTPTTGGDLLIRGSDGADAPTEIASTSGKGTRLAPGRRRSRGGWLAAAVVVVGAGVGGWWAWQQGLVDRVLSGAAPAGPVPPVVTEDAAARSAPDSTLVLSAAGSIDAGTQGAAEGSGGANPPPDPDPEPVRPPPARSRPTPPATQAAPPVPQVGFLTIDATPWGLVYIDEVEIRDTPLVRHEVSVGQHVVRITQTSCRDYVDTVQVAAGANRRLAAVLSCGGRS